MKIMCTEQAELDELAIKYVYNQLPVSVTTEIFSLFIAWSRCSPGIATEGLTYIIGGKRVFLLSASKVFEWWCVKSVLVFSTMKVGTCMFFWCMNVLLNPVCGWKSGCFSPVEICPTKFIRLLFSKLLTMTRSKRKTSASTVYGWWPLCSLPGKSHYSFYILAKQSLFMSIIGTFVDQNNIICARVLKKI